MKTMKLLTLLGPFLAVHGSTTAADWVAYEGKEGPATGKHIVFLTGDEEYRSEEGMPMLAKILSQRHGFRCTVLFPINSADGTIDPNNQTNIVGMENVDSADLVVMLFRFRELPDASMKHFMDTLESGKPLIAFRTSTHAFAYSRNKKSPYAKWDWQSNDPPGGFGRHVLGDTWISHHGSHGSESTRGVLNPAMKDHPILRGAADIWGPTDVYGVAHLPKDAQVLVHGQVLRGMKPTDPPVEGKKNDPMMPLIWTREHKWPNGKTSKTLTSTIGAATDLESEGLRRLVVNACYAFTGLQDKIPAKADVAIVGEYKPTTFGFNGFKKGAKPKDHELR